MRKETKAVVSFFECVYFIDFQFIVQSKSKSDHKKNEIATITKRMCKMRITKEL